MIRKCRLLAVFAVAVCPACAESPNMAAPQTAAANARAVDVDAPNGMCRAGAQMLDHVGCIDEELSFSVDALDVCRSTGETECSTRCQQGDAPSCTSLALVHAFALETGPNTTYAARLLDHSCASGDGPACTDLGVLHAKGLGFPVDVERAETLYAVACDRGDIVGCADLTRARTWGADPPENVVRAAGVVENACLSTSDARACAALGSMRERGSAVPRDQALAASLFSRACQAGDVASCDELGRAYLAGNGVAPDDVTALQLFRRACDRARSDACTDLAEMYCMGRGVPRDAARSTILLRQACEAGDDAACHAKSCTGWAPL
jgi:TPR repeat protein